MAPRSVSRARFRRQAGFRVPVLVLLAGLPAVSARAQSAASGPAAGSAVPGIVLGVPATGAFDFHQKGGDPDSLSARMRAAPVPDPSTLPKPDRSLRDPATGADTTAFGTAYTYPNPRTDTTSAQPVGNAASRSAGLPVNTGGLVILEWGTPRPPMPAVPGEDLTAAPPPIRAIAFAVQATDEAWLDAKSLWTVSRAVQAYGRANLVEIAIERPAGRPECCRSFPALLRTELIREGIGPDPAHLLPDHRIRLVLAGP